MKTEEKIKKSKSTFKTFVEKANTAYTGNGEAPLKRVVRDCPLLEKDVVTFKTNENTCAAELLSLESITGSTNTFIAVKDSNGRLLSATSLIGRKGNGINVNGVTLEERLQAFINLIDEKGEISFRVAKIRVLPATNQEYNAQRIITWEAI